MRIPKVCPDCDSTDLREYIDKDHIDRNKKHDFYRHYYKCSNDHAFTIVVKVKRQKTTKPKRMPEKEGYRQELINHPKGSYYRYQKRRENK